MLETHTYSQVCSFLVAERSTQADANNHKQVPFRTLAHLERVARRLQFFSRRTRTFRTSFTQGVPSWRAGTRILSLSSGCTLFLWDAFQSTLLLESVDLPSTIVCNLQYIYFSLALGLPFGCSARGGLQVVFYEPFSRNFWSRNQASIFLCLYSPEIHTLNSILNAPQQQWLQKESVLKCKVSNRSID